MSLKNYWYIAARSRDLGREPIARTVFEEPLVLFRQADGTPAALRDRCAHRNAPLSAGCVVGGTLRCPYHGWRYGSDGSLLEIPSLARGQVLPPVPPLPAHPVRELHDHVWVHPGGVASGDGPAGFPHYGETGWTTFTMYNRFEAGVDACLENFLDVPHSVFVHRGLFRNPDPRDVVARVTRSGSRVAAEFADEPDPQSVVSRLLFPGMETLVHTDAFMLPSTSRVDYDFSPDRHFIITSQCTPVESDVTDVYTVVTYRFGSIGGLVRLLFEPLSCRIIRQDVEILARVTRQARRSGGARHTVIETDLLLPHIQYLRSRADRGAGEDPVDLVRDVVLRF